MVPRDQLMDHATRLSRWLRPPGKGAGELLDTGRLGTNTVPIVPVTVLSLARFERGHRDVGRINSSCLILVKLVIADGSRLWSPGKSIKGGLVDGLSPSSSSSFLNTFFSLPRARQPTHTSFASRDSSPSYPRLTQSTITLHYPCPHTQAAPPTYAIVPSLLSSNPSFHHLFEP